MSNNYIEIKFLDEDREVIAQVYAVLGKETTWKATSKATIVGMEANIGGVIHNLTMHGKVNVIKDMPVKFTIHSPGIPC